MEGSVGGPSGNTDPPKRILPSPLYVVRRSCEGRGETFEGPKPKSAIRMKQGGQGVMSGTKRREVEKA